MSPTTEATGRAKAREKTMTWVYPEKPSDGELAGVERINQHAQIGFGVFAENLRVCLLRCVHERLEPATQQFAVAFMHPNIVYGKEVVGMPQILVLTTIS